MVSLAGRAPTAGCFAEVGVYKGGSLKQLGISYPGRTILGFDSFEGLPAENWTAVDLHRPKEFSDTSFEEVNEFLKDCNNINLIKGIFPASAVHLENIDFAFVHIDTDFYLSVKACLDWFWPRLLKGGIIVLDDYLWPACPGVQQALIEFEKPYQKTAADFQAYLVKEQ